MAYKKNYKRKYTRRYKRKGATSAASNAMRFVRKGAKTALYAYSAYKLATRLADKINPEFKEYEVQSNPTPDWNGTIVNLCVPAQGTAYNQRIADSLKMQTLTVRGYVKAGPSNAETLRIMVFIDKQNQITTGADMLDNTGTGYATLGAKNEDNKYISQILWDRTFSVSPQYRPIVPFKIVMPINVHEHFVAGTATLKDNALKQMVISDLGSGSASATVVWCSYVSYSDD